MVLKTIMPRDQIKVLSGFGGLGVSVLASGTQVKSATTGSLVCFVDVAVGFLRAEKSSARLPSEGK
jgi:hypothetical protein